MHGGGGVRDRGGYGLSLDRIGLPAGKVDPELTMHADLGRQ